MHPCVQLCMHLSVYSSDHLAICLASYITELVKARHNAGRNSFFIKLGNIVGFIK